MRIKNIFLIAIGASLLLNACVSFDYAAFKESRPRSILVMPPINNSPDVNAPHTFLATSAYPLAESGYYVIPVTLSNETFRQNGVTVAEEAHAISHRRLHEIFGADAALYITITKYGSKFMVTTTSTEAEASVKLVDLRNGVEIWHGDVYANSDDSASINTGGIFGILATVAANAAIQAINVATDEAYNVGRDANHKMLSAGEKNKILYGPYHPKYGTD